MSATQQQSMPAGKIRPYHRQEPVTWWLKRKPYLIFMLREASAIFVGIYSVWLLFLVKRLQEGPAAYALYIESLRSPAWVLYHIVALAFVLLHTITWFNLTPKAMVVRRGEERVPDAMLIVPNYAAWVVVSAVVAWIILRA